jgi:hypothetical protein
MLGLLPILRTSRTGVIVMKRNAALMIGGMVSSTIPHAARDPRDLLARQGARTECRDAPAFERRARAKALAGVVATA